MSRGRSMMNRWCVVDSCCTRRSLPANLARSVTKFEVAKRAVRPRRPERPRARLPSAPVVGQGRLEALREGVVSGQEPIGDRDLPSFRYAQFLPQDVAMGFRGAGGDAQSLTDLVVRAAGCDQLDDLALSLRDAGIGEGGH